METTRLDKWLWAARFYKTRSLATNAINAGHVHLNQERVKPAKAVKVGDVVRVRKGSSEQTVTVLLISDKRGSAPIAQTLYEETPDSLLKREQNRARVQAESAGLFSHHKPNKRERRQLLDMKHHHNTLSK